MPKPKILLALLLIAVCVVIGVGYAMRQLSIVCGGPGCDGAPVEVLK